jgi:dipeptidyl aminopeptidase/acylaminoacyl peptidase
MAVTRPYGLWPSPISPRGLAHSLRLNDVQWDDDGRTLVWVEGRSDRSLLVAQQGDDAPRDLTPVGLGVRARIGFGGGEFGLHRGQLVFPGTGNRLYRQALAGGPARPITPAFGAAAAPALSPDGRWVLYIHSDEGRDCLALVDAEGQSWPQRLVSGDDFYMQPAWSPHGAMLAWVSWSHPQMPWDGSRLVVGHLETTAGLPRLAEYCQLVGDERTAVFQPTFSPDGRFLAYIADPGGWGMLYLHDLEQGTTRRLSSGSFELARPAWVQGMRVFAFSPDGAAIFYIRNVEGFASLWRVDIASGVERQIGGDLAGYSWLDQISVAPGSGRVALIASSSVCPPRVISVDPTTGAARIHRRSGDEQIDPAGLSRPTSLSWPAPDNSPVHGLYYPPASASIASNGKPPAIVRVHGGPTDQATARWDGATQFLATRGYAVLQLNYRGSTGYGRAYMEALRGEWGVVDVEDAAGAAHFLAHSGLADAERLAIMGSSAGGFTVLNTLIRHPGLFRAALCMYGVTDLFGLAAETHKFEERYTDSLVGPLPGAAARYRERSPAFHAEQIADALALFQGSDDEVVPPSQADAIVARLRASGVPHEYHVYAGEGHGWRKPETIAQFWETVERFLRNYLIFA